MTLGVTSKLPATTRTKPNSSSVSMSRRAFGRASPAAAAASQSDMLQWWASKQARTSRPRASASTKSGPAPRPAIRLVHPVARVRARSQRPRSFSRTRLAEHGAAHAVRRLGLVVGVLVRVSRTSSCGRSGFMRFTHASSPKDERTCSTVRRTAGDNR